VGRALSQGEHAGHDEREGGKEAEGLSQLEEDPAPGPPPTCQHVEAEEEDAEQHSHHDPVESVEEGAGRIQAGAGRSASCARVERVRIPGVRDRGKTDIDEDAGDSRDTGDLRRGGRYETGFHEGGAVLFRMMIWP
jgi:hypothetical protein